MPRIGWAAAVKPYKIYDTKQLQSYIETMRSENARLHAELQDAKKENESLKEAAAKNSGLRLKFHKGQPVVHRDEQKIYVVDRVEYRLKTVLLGEPRGSVEECDLMHVNEVHGFIQSLQGGVKNGKTPNS